MVKKVEPESDPIQHFSVDVKEPMKSVFDEEKKAEEEEDIKIKAIKARLIDDDEPDYEKADEYGKSRIHAWVLIMKGYKEMPETIFIEPTTGRQYSIDDSPYFSIEAIFNH